MYLFIAYNGSSHTKEKLGGKPLSSTVCVYMWVGVCVSMSPIVFSLYKMELSPHCGQNFMNEYIPFRI